MRQLIIIILLSGIWSCQSPEATDHSTEKDSVSVQQKPAKNSSVLMLTSRASQLAGVTTAVVGQGTISDPVVLFGRTAADPGRSSVVTTRFGGRLEKLYIREQGAQVRTGDAVADIFSPELTAQAGEYLRLKAEASATSLAGGARRRLMQQGISENEIDSWSAPPRLFTIRATSSGFTASVESREGSQVSPGTVILRLEDTGRIRAEALIQPGSNIILSSGQQVKVECAGQSITGVVDRTDPVTAEDNPGVKVYINLPAGISGIRVNLPVRVIVEEKRRTGLLIPASSVFYHGQEARVFITSGKDTYELKNVRTSPVRLGMVEITEGLNAGDTVVTSGSYLLHSELLLRAGQTDSNESHLH